MYGYIYKTTNLITNIIYTGQHVWSGPDIDPNYLGSGIILLRAIKKYGKGNFKCEILTWCETLEELNYWEKFYIKKFNDEGIISYNIAEGGSCGDLRKFMSEEDIAKWRQKLSESHKGVQAGEKHPMYGKHHSEETRRQLSLTHSGVNHPNYGKHLSEETKKKIGDANRLKTGTQTSMYGKHHSEETKHKMSISSSKKVINLTTGEVFNSLEEASQKYHVAKSSICFCCQGKYKHAAKQRWAYFE